MFTFTRTAIGLAGAVGQGPVLRVPVPNTECSRSNVQTPVLGMHGYIFRRLTESKYQP